jgi:hypothetical protein
LRRAFFVAILSGMSDTFKDLDALVPDDLEVKLGGVRYTIPGDLPLEIYIRINKASDMEVDDEESALSAVNKAMVDLFAWLYQGKPEEARIREDVTKVLSSRGLRWNTRLIQSIYGKDIDETETVVEEAGPTS